MGYWRGVDGHSRGAGVNAPSESFGLVGSTHRRLPVLAALVGLVLVVSGLALVTLGRLDHVYSRDQLGYHEKAVRLSRDLQSSPVRAAHGVAQSVRHQNYNDLAAVPLAAWVAVFGEHRQSFVLGVLLLYAVPTSALFAVLMATACRRFCGRDPTLWLAVGWLVTPWLVGAFWMPTIVGRVGVGGLGLVFAAVALHIRRPLDRQGWWEPVAVGALLAAAVLFQRWYLFAVVGVLAAIAAQAVLACARPERAASRAGLVGRLLVVTLTPAMILAPLTAPIIHRIVHTAYADIFSYYRHPGSVMYLWGNPWSLAERLGLPSLLVVVAAFILGMLRKQLRGFLTATALSGAVSLALFSQVQAPGIHHALIWVGVACVVLGIGLAQLAVLPRMAARIAVGASVALLGSSVAAVLFLSRGSGPDPGRLWWSLLAPSMTVGEFLPANRDLVLAAVEVLESNIPAGSSIAFLSSGFRLNDDALRNIGLSLPECDLGTRYRFPVTRTLTPHGRSPEYVLRADYVAVVALPATRDLPRHGAARVPPEWLFRPTSPLLECFDRVVGAAALPDGLTMSVFTMKRGMEKETREILAGELEAVFGEGRGSEPRP